MLASSDELCIAGKRTYQKLELTPEIAVATALDLCGKFPQAGGAVVRGVALARGAGCVGAVARMQQRLAVERAILGDEQEN